MNENFNYVKQNVLKKSLKNKNIIFHAYLAIERNYDYEFLKRFAACERAGMGT